MTPFIPRRPPSRENEAWDRYLAARDVYTKAPGPRTQAGVQAAYRALCQAMGMSEVETEEAGTVLNHNNGWAPLAIEAAA